MTSLKQGVERDTIFDKCWNLLELQIGGFIGLHGKARLDFADHVRTELQASHTDTEKRKNMLSHLGHIMNDLEVKYAKYNTHLEHKK